MADGESYKRTLRELSDRLVEAQRPIRILDSVQWDVSVEEAFFAAGARQLPAVDRAYYERRALSFDAEAKLAELAALEREVASKLGTLSPVAGILRRMCREYATVVRMLAGRGTRQFSLLSQELYGSANDAFHAGDPTLADLGRLLSEALTNIDASQTLEPDEKCISGEEAVAILQQRLASVFPEPEHGARVILDDGIVADASAGADRIKIRREARFSERDLRLLELHEGWVHLATSLNGRRQPVCTFLSKGPPSSTVTQEGLAVLVEILAFASQPERVRRVTRRIEAIRRVEEGANFLDIYRYLLDEGQGERDAYAQATRVFRGSLPDAGPFTKDLSYSKGFVLVYNYVQLAVRRGLLRRIPLLFCGKTMLEDVRTLDQLVAEGLVEPPAYLPPPIADQKALAAWMCYSNFLNHLDLRRIEADYASIL